MAISKCCGCISLKTGSYIIAKLTIIITCAVLRNSPEAREFLYYHSPTFSPTLLTYLIFWLILPVILILGVYTMSSTITLIFLCGGIINFMIISYFCIISLIAAFISADKSLYLSTFFPIIYGYFLVVVFYFYQELKNGKDNQVDNESLIES